MIRITTRIIGLAALAAGGIVMATGMAEGNNAEPQAKIADRHPGMIVDSVFKALPQPGDPHRHVSATDTKSGRAYVLGCARQAWPYVEHYCLTRADGGVPRRPARTVTVERRGDGMSTLHRGPAPRMASR